MSYPVGSVVTTSLPRSSFRRESTPDLSRRLGQQDRGTPDQNRSPTTPNSGSVDPELLTVRREPSFRTREGTPDCGTGCNPSFRPGPTPTGRTLHPSNSVVARVHHSLSAVEVRGRSPHIVTRLETSHGGLPRPVTVRSEPVDGANPGLQTSPGTTPSFLYV